MSDPLSVAAGVVGLITAAAQVSLILNDIINRTKNAPNECKRLRNDVDEVHNILGQLSRYVIGTKQAARSRKALIMVDQVATTLAACITTFDELKLLVESLKSDSAMGILDRFRWIAKSEDLKQMLARIEAHKSSLTLMLGILTCQKQDDAEDKVDYLCEMIEIILKQNAVLAQRMAVYDTSQLMFSQSATQHTEPTFDPAMVQDQAPELAFDTIQRNLHGFAFEEQLMRSRAYRAVEQNSSDAFSIASSVGKTATWSILSGLSLSELSSIAIMAIPVYESDLNDKTAYSFESPSEELPLEPKPGSVVPASTDDRSTSTPKRKLRDWWDKFSQHEQQQQPRIPLRKPVFGVALSESLLYANVAISLTSEAGESFIYGYIPIVVAQTGVWLKQEGLEIDDLFTRSGHAARVAALQKTFDDPATVYGKQLYGSTIRGAGYTIFDVATVLLRYLKCLPDPVIPSAFYQRFRNPILHYKTIVQNASEALVMSEEQEHSKVILAFQKAILELPSLNRQLLLYLLDLFAVFTIRRDKSRVTAQTLAFIFRPGIVLRPTLELAEHEIGQDVLVFLIENQDHFLIGMSGTGIETDADQGK